MLRRILFDATFIFFFLAVTIIWFFVQDEEQLLNLGKVSLFAVLLFAVSCCLSWVLGFRKIRTLGIVLLSSQDGAIEEAPWWRQFWRWQLFLSLMLAFIVALVKTEFSLPELFDAGGFAGAVRLFKGMLDPNWEVLPRAILNIIETIFMAFLATALAIPVAFVFSFLCAKNIMQGYLAKILYFVFRTLLNVTRSVESLIWAIIFSVWVGIGPFAGMLALMLHSIASLTKQYSEMVETADDGPIEAIKSTGAGKLSVVWYGIVPQVLLPYISFTLYRWDINVRMATVIGLVGGGGIGTMLIQYQGQAMWREVGCIVLVIAIVVWALDQVSAFIRAALK